MGNRKSRNKYFTSFCMVLLTTVLISGLTGCQIVEPEKRAYPLVVGIDWQQEQYQIYLGMAQLAVSTGQGKESGDEQKGDEEGALLLTGASREEIMEIYNQTQELYLDPGHVQAVIFGKGILQDTEQMVHVLGEMEKEISLGNSAYVFAAEDIETIMGTNGNQVESLGQYLSGIYENRTEDIHPITLSQLYRELHNQNRILQLAKIGLDHHQLCLEKTERSE